MTRRLVYRAPSDPQCRHRRITRTIAKDAGFASHRDAAVYECPDCGYRNYGDVGNAFDRANRKAFGMT